MANNCFVYNNAISGTVAGAMASRWFNSTMDDDETTEPLIAKAVAFATKLDEILNNPVSDADDNEVGQAVNALCHSFWQGRYLEKTTAAEYTEEATALANLIQEVIGNMVSCGA